MTAANPKQQILDCRACGLWLQGGGPVPFRGKPSEIMVIGEAPGQTEDARGKPFIGPAGQLLWSTLDRIGMAEDGLFIANAVSCYPARTPTTQEIKCCRGNLRAQIRYCDPYFILALGVVANLALDNDEPISRLRGNWYSYRCANKEIDVFPTLHPAAVLRNRALMRGWRQDLETFVEETLG